MVIDPNLRILLTKFREKPSAQSHTDTHTHTNTRTHTISFSEFSAWDWFFISLICSAVNLHCLWLLKYREREINIIGLAPGQNHPWQCARQAFEIIGAYPRVWGIKIIPRLFAREREAQCPGLKGRVPHGSANWLRRSDTGISFCRGEGEGGVWWW